MLLLFVGTAAPSYEQPNIGITVNTFKATFNRRMTDPKCRLDERRIEVMNRTSFTYSFSASTIINVYADDKGKIQNIELDGVEKEPALFWRCAEAIVWTVNPTATAETRRNILMHLGRTANVKALPSTGAMYDRQELNYQFSPNVQNKTVSLVIQSNAD